MRGCPVKVVPQNTLAELAQVPERTSTTAWKLPANVSVCVAPPAVKLYQTSFALVAKPQPVVGGNDCAAPATVPLTGVMQAVVIGNVMAPAQLSLVGGVGPAVRQSVKAELAGNGGTAAFAYKRRKYVWPLVNPLKIKGCPVKAAPQNTLVEVAQVPERTSTTAWKLPVNVSICVAPPAVKLYQTSLAILVKPQVVEAGNDCEAPFTVPLTGVMQAVVTGSATAEAHSSLDTGVGPGFRHSVNCALAGVTLVLE